MYVQTAITLFNKRISDDRREVYYPTRLSSASYLESLGSSSSEGKHTENLSYKMRIPVYARAQEDRAYVSAAEYKALSAEDAAACWTIQKEDIILAGALELTAPVTEMQIRELATANAMKLIQVREYADNTIRGSSAVQHWRIGGV